jgi:hypothetical protein
MRSLQALGAGLALIAGVAAAPAAAQDSRRVADEIARSIRDAANAIGTVTEAVDESVADVRFRGRDRFAVDRCRPHAERYGRVRIDEVRPYERRSFRVYGTVEGGYDRSYSSRDRHSLRSFTCTVRDDGRVKFKTKRLRG